MFEDYREEENNVGELFEQVENEKQNNAGESFAQVEKEKQNVSKCI